MELIVDPLAPSDWQYFAVDDIPYRSHRLSVAWDKTGQRYNLGQGLRNLTAILAPEVISLGGGVAVGGGENLIRQARKVMQSNMNLVPVPELRISTLGYDTALLGASAVAIHGIKA